MSICLSLSLSLSACLSVSLSLCLSLSLSACLSVCLSVCLSICLSISISLLFYLSPSLPLPIPSPLALPYFSLAVTLPNRNILNHPNLCYIEQLIISPTDEYILVKRDVKESSMWDYLSNGKIEHVKGGIYLKERE